MTDRTNDRMSAAELAAEADELAASARPLPPMPLSEILDYFGDELRDRRRDLWTLRTSIDAELTGDRHALAVAALATMAEGYAEALEAVRRIAADAGHELPIDRGGPPW